MRTRARRVSTGTQDSAYETVSALPYGVDMRGSPFGPSDPGRELMRGTQQTSGLRRAGGSCSHRYCSRRRGGRHTDPSGRVRRTPRRGAMCARAALRGGLRGGYTVVLTSCLRHRSAPAAHLTPGAIAGTSERGESRAVRRRGRQRWRPGARMRVLHAARVVAAHTSLCASRAPGTRRVRCPRVLRARRRDRQTPRRAHPMCARTKIRRMRPPMGSTPFWRRFPQKSACRGPYRHRTRRAVVRHGSARPHGCLCKAARRPAASS